MSDLTDKRKMKDDLISRSAFADALCVACNKEYPEEPCEPSECLIRQALATAPAVDAVEVVHGRWIDEVELHPELYGWVPINMWTNGRMIADESASRCPEHTKLRDSAAYQIGKLEAERNDDD